MPFDPSSDMTTDRSLSTMPLPALPIAEETYQAERLSLPPFPRPFDNADLLEVGTYVYATAPLGEHANLYPMGAFLDAALSGTLPSRVLAFGFGGHGLASTATHYYLITPYFIVMVQQRWACFLDDEDEVRGNHDSMLRMVAGMAEAAASAETSGIFPPDKRLVATWSTFSSPRYAWIPRKGGATEAEIPWQYEEFALLSAKVEIAKLSD